MCDRLVRKGLIRRHRQAGDRRSVRITLTAAGRDLVAEATRRRRAELTRLLAALPPGQHEPVIAAFRAFAAAAGELPQPVPRSAGRARNLRERICVVGRELLEGAGGRPRRDGTSLVPQSASPSAVRLNAWAFISAICSGTPARIIASLFSSKLSSE
jgi:hypothetical protein